MAPLRSTRLVALAVSVAFFKRVYTVYRPHLRELESLIDCCVHVRGQDPVERDKRWVKKLRPSYAAFPYLGGPSMGHLYRIK